VGAQTAVCEGETASVGWRGNVGKMYEKNIAEGNYCFYDKVYVIK